MVRLPLLNFLFGSFCFAVAHDLQAISTKLKGDEHVFVDETGRERIFHGTNAVVKGPPWVPDSRTWSPDISMAMEDFEWMQKLGLNVLRLGVMWPGVEPERGQYNETYLDELDRIVKLAAEYGVYTLLDGHQDGLSEFFCGEGIPHWAVKRVKEDWYDPFSKPFPAPFDTLDRDTDYYQESRLPGAPYLPSRKACHSKNTGPGHMEVTEEAAQAYQALYDNWNHTGDAWAAMWAKVAARFRGRPEILGIELINEPFAGDLYHNPAMMVPWPNPLSADHTNLEPAYDHVSKAVRNVDDQLLIFFAGVTWDDVGPGFWGAPGGHEYNDRTVLAYHYYEKPQFNVDLQLSSYVKAGKRLGTGAFLTETSMPGSSGAEKFSKPGGIGDGADNHLQSWAGFQWKSFFREPAGPEPQVSQFGDFGAHKTGTTANWPGSEPDQNIQEASARTYAQSVAGAIRSMYFNVTSGFFELQYDCGKICDTATEIYTWPGRYPGGPLVQATAAAGEVHTVILAESSKVEIRLRGASDQRIVVKIRPLAHERSVLV